MRDALEVPALEPRVEISRIDRIRGCFKGGVGDGSGGPTRQSPSIIEHRDFCQDLSGILRPWPWGPAPLELWPGADLGPNVGS